MFSLSTEMNDAAMNERDPQPRQPAATRLRRGRVARLGLAVFGMLAFVATAAVDAASGVHFDGKTYTNRLIHSQDPYLLLHAHNPVDWYPWGAAAIAAARRENKPIFLSVGYSTCYWCHVAEREIYSNPKIAALMNRWFINIKVDREQRPDVDRVYMLATQIMTGGGGWPNNVFLTPDLKPFYAGSYFPPADQDGRPGFPTLLASLHRAWGDDRAKLIDTGARVYRAMQQAGQGASPAGRKLQPAQWLKLATRQAAAQYDELARGFSGGGATMFPQSPLLAMLLTGYERHRDQQTLAMVAATLTAMAEGGVMDQLGGGFHRYSTDPDWDIPHFEKMLYDNAQLLGLYARAYALTKQPLFKQVAQRTAHYLSTEMQAPGGGFYSAQDAQVGGVEGASYVWTRAQIESLLGAADARRFFTLYALVPMPNSIGGQAQSPGSVLRLARDAADKLAAQHRLAGQIEALAPLRAKLLAARKRRAQPAIDEKIVTANNALAILGFLEAGQALDDPGPSRIALATANWEWAHAFNAKTGLLRHQFFRGHAGNDAYLDDYALLGQAFLALHRTTGDPVWLARARRLADAMMQRFARPDGRLASTADSANLLIAPPPEGDSVQPSGESAAVALLLGLAVDGGDARYAAAARRALAPLAAQIAAEPAAWGALLAAISAPSYSALLQAPDAAGSAVGGSPRATDHVHADARWLAPGVLGIGIDIDVGYHINANPASDPDLIPTQLSLPGQPAWQVSYPQAQRLKLPFAPQGLAVYTGHVELRATLPTGRAAASKAELRVQACNDKYCLAPGTLVIDVPRAP